jgi:hypothetical protein
MSRRPLYSAEHVQIPNRVLLLRSPCAPRLQVPCSASRVVPGAHRVVGPGTHRCSGPREVHTTTPSFLPVLASRCRPHPQKAGTAPPVAITVIEAATKSPATCTYALPIKASDGTLARPFYLASQPSTPPEHHQEPPPCPPW